MSFSIRHFTSFHQIPLDELDKLSHSIYIIDYNWKFLFVNQNCKDVFGQLGLALVGRSALTLFRDTQFKPIFDELAYSVNRRIAFQTVLYSPLRYKQVKVTGFPLDDCYFFSSIPLPGKDEVVDDLRTILKKKDLP